MADTSLETEGYTRAVETLHLAATPQGFLASTTTKDNYRRIWGRDGAICSLAALLLNDNDLNNTVLATLRTLMHHQGPHGEIPSNVDPEQGAVSYGGTAGRVDASLWWLIACHRYWQVTQDERFIDEFLPNIKRVQLLLGAWEFNNKGLLYIPETGDWADEYIQHGYVLYDQLLYARALEGICEFYDVSKDSIEHVIRSKSQQVRKLIQANYWFYKCDASQVDAYHPIIFQKGCEAAEYQGSHWMPFFSPTGYGYRFDAMANVLASLTGIATEDRSAQVDEYIDENVVREDLLVLPAFTPVIDEQDKDWASLQVAYSNTFKNKPYEFHNGGLWPLINGFYVADLVRRKKMERAKKYQQATHRANKLSTGPDEEWGFYEFINGKTLSPGGTRHQTWSATAAIIGHHAIIDKAMPL